MCQIDDDVRSIVALADQSEALVLASPVNMYDVTAVTRMFLERLIPCGYWPWGQGGPTWRNREPARLSILITSTAMPAIMARYFTRSMKSLKDMSKCLCAKPVDRVYLGMMASRLDQPLPDRAKRRVRRAAGRLLD